jgi:hypothetical protein
MSTHENDPVAHQWMMEFRSTLETLGWVDGRNIATEIRWYGGEPDRANQYARELVDLAPDVIVVRTRNMRGTWHAGAMEMLGPSFKVELSMVAIRASADIENAISTFAREPNSALIVFSSAITTANRDRIIDLAAGHRLPTIHPFKYFTERGGLISYGIDPLDIFRRSASYAGVAKTGIRLCLLRISVTAEQRETVRSP